MNLKHQLQRGMKNFNWSYSVSDTQYYFEYTFKKHGEKTVNSLIGIYVNIMQKKIKLKINTGYYIELLTPETIKLHGSTKIKITENQTGKNVPHLEINDVVLASCNIAHNDCQ